MIKLENTEIMNMEGAIRGMRNPLDSWNKSDSSYCLYDEEYAGTCEKCEYKDIGCGLCAYQLGPNDLALAKKLVKAGSDHRKFLRQILVSVDITAPIYWWKEFDTYKVGTVSNSCSTMHTIIKKEFRLSDFSFDKLYGSYTLEIAKILVDTLNDLREKYKETNDKNVWYQIIQLLPSSYNQRRTITLNYEVIKNMRSSRTNHKLDEWSDGFITWSDSLPYANDLLK